MNTDDWLAVEQAFFDARQLAEAERSDWLVRRFPDRPELRAEVERLLHSDAEVGHVFEDAVERAAFEAGAAQASGHGGASTGPPEESAQEPPSEAAEKSTVIGGDNPPAARLPVGEPVLNYPQRIGPFRIVGKLGEGGMGVVLRGERDDGTFEQAVAIKLVRGGYFRGALERFEQERRLLAQVDHPNIARVIDGGATAEGVPFLVMEYVDGEPVDAYVDRNRLSVDQRLELFQEICRAVGHAHAQLVVHRDLKPSNILVDRAGRVKLLDFGIAKLLDEDPGDEQLTVHGERVLSRDYASPEQFRGERVTTASDVFSLGVLLYRLLAGQNPFERHRKDLRAFERAVRELEPDPPSSTVRRLGVDEPERAAIITQARSTSTPRLIRRLRGDLDQIVRRALRKEPAARYTSVGDLSADIDRHLQALPVLASQGGWRYRTGRFLRRHRTAAAVTAAALAALSVGLVGQIRAARQARMSATEAAEVSNFLVDLFEVADPDEARGNEITARQILDSGVERIRSEMSEQPRVQARLMRTMGSVYRNLGLYEPSEELLRDALVLRRRDDPQSTETAEVLVNLAQVLRDQDQHTESEALLDEARGIRQRHFGRDSLGVAQIDNDLGLVLRNTGDYERAEELTRRALEVRRSAGGSREDIARNLNNLGLIKLDRGRYQEGRDHLEEALELKRQLWQGDHPSIGIGLMTLAGAEAQLSNPERAEELYAEAVPLLERTFGARHYHVANALNGQASALHDQTRYAEAEPVYERGLAIAREAVGERHRLVGQLTNNLAWLHLDRGDLGQAEPLFRRSLALRIDLWGEDNPDVARAEHNLASLLAEMGQVEEAEERFRRALVTRRATLRADHPEIGATASDLAELLTVRGCDAEAMDLSQAGVSILEAGLRADHPRIHRARQNLGICLLWNGDAAAAAPLIREADAALRQENGTSPRILGLSARRMSALAEALAAGS